LTVSRRDKEKWRRGFGQLPFTFPNHEILAMNEDDALYKYKIIIKYPIPSGLLLTLSTYSTSFHGLENTFP
jgi:hypothetical protein